MSKQASNRKPLIVGIIAAVMILAVLLVLLLTQCTQGGGSGASETDTTAGKPVIENADLYWNVDRALYDGKSEGGMSSRRAESDGYFHVRFFKDGQMLELKVESRSVVNKIEVRDLMGLVFDDNGIVTDVIDIEYMPVEKVGWKFYVQSVGGHLIKVNSSDKFDGLEVLLDTQDGAKVYDMTGTLGEIGCETEAMLNDRVLAVADLEGKLLAVYVYDRSNMVVEFQAYCKHCDQEVTWQEWDNEKKLPVIEGHFQLVTDVQLNGQQSIQSDAKICLDLNGHTVDGKEGSRVYSVHSLNSELAIMDTSEEQTGKLAAHGEIYAQGCVIWARSGDVFFYEGTLDASDAVCTGRGGAAVYVAAERFFYMYGGEIIGGTAKYYYNEDNGSYANGLGGSVYCIGKFTLKDGVIRDGRAQSVSFIEKGKTVYRRGLGGNIYVGTGGQFVMDGGTIKNGRAGSSGNIYMDGTAEFTMNGGSITGGYAMDPGRDGGNLNMGAKATFTMNGGVIGYGTSVNNAGNVYCAGTFVMNSGMITGGRTVDSKTGKAKENAAGANMTLSSASRLYMYGGTIQGQVSAVDSSKTDGKHTTIVLAGLPKIYSGTEGITNLTLQTGAEPVRVQVAALHDLAKIGINAAGKFTLETKEENRDNFVSDIAGAEILYVDNCLAIGKIACLCGSKTEQHVGNCDGKELLWGPWTSKTSLPNREGNFFLVSDVERTAPGSFGSSSDNAYTISLDLNGKTVRSAQRVATLYCTVNLADHVGGGRMIGAGLKEGNNHTGAVLLTKGSALNIYGGTIALADDHYDLTTGGAMGIGDGAVVNLYGGAIDGRSADTENKVGNGGTVRLSGILNVLGGTVYGGTANRGGAIYVEKTGLLNVAGGSITGGTSEENGGAIYVAGGKVTMSGGTITGGTGVEGGNIRIQASGQFDMTGGTIEKGTSSNAGGNVSLLTGQFNLRGGEVKDGIGSNGGNFVVASTLNISGGAVSGGKTSGNGYGGNIHMSDAKAVVNLSGGTVTGGYTANRGGNLSGIGTLNMTGGTIKDGDAVKGGGNVDGGISSSITLNISGGTITGGLYNGNADTDRGNIYMTTGNLNISGNAVIDGGVLLVNNVKTTLSGEPQIQGNTWSIKLRGVDMPAPTLKVGDLEPTAKIGINHEGLFGVEAEAGDTGCFIPADNDHIIYHDPADNTLYAGRIHCLCVDGNADWCDHKMVLWTKWDGKSNISEGNYYLGSDVTMSKNLTIGETGKTLNICLNGHVITCENNRIMNVKGNVSIFDHSEGNGALVSTGIGSKLDHTAVAAVSADATLNLYGGSLKLAQNHNELSSFGGVVSVAAKGVMNIYGGSVDASASLTSGKAIGAGGAIRVDGQLNIYGGEVIGGKVTGNGGAILLRTATAEVNISGGKVSGGNAANGGAIQVEAGKLSISGGTVENGVAAAKGGNINQVKGNVSISDKALIQNGRANQGGNLAVTPADNETVCQLSVSGGQIKGGSASNAKGNDANLYVNNTVLKLSGGEIDGGVSVVNVTGTKAYVELSGAPKIQKAGAVNLRLAKSGGTQPVVKIMGQLTGEPGSIGITAGTLGVVAAAGDSYTITETDKDYFTSDDPAYRLRLNAAAVELYAPHLHCWCENADTVPADHTCVADQEWTAIEKSGNAFSIGEGGCYYLNWTGSAAKSIKVNTDEPVYLCLNGASIRAGDCIQLGENAQLTICDCSEGQKGEITTTKNSPVKLAAGQTVNLYSGTINGTYTTAASRVSVLMSGGTFNMYGGRIVNGCSNASADNKETEADKGGNVYISDGAFNICGGTISGGKLGSTDCDVILRDGSLTVGGGAKIGAVTLAKNKTITVSAEKPLTGTKVIGIALEETPAIGSSVAVATGATSKDAFHSINVSLNVLFDNGTVKLEKDASGLGNMELKYDDRKDVAQWLNLNESVTSVNITNQVPTSKQVGTNTLDDKVLEYKDGTLYAVGTGTAILTVNGQSYNVTVKPAKLSLFMITGHSLAVGQSGDPDKSLVVEAGQAYSTYAGNNHKWDADKLDAVLDSTGGLGHGSANRASATLDAFAPGQGGNLGEGSAIAWSWTQKTGEKVWVLNTAKGGSTIIDWLPSSYNSGYTEKYDCHDHAVTIFNEALDILTAEIAAGHYTLGDVAVIYHNGGNFSKSNDLKDENGQLTFTWDQLKEWYDVMWNSYQTNFNKDLDGDGKEDTVKLGLSNSRTDLLYDNPLGHYLGVTNPDMFTVLENYAKWKNDLSTFPEPNYPVQDGSVLKAPESVHHIDQGGTSENSFHCKEDKVHLSQVAYNAMGLDVAANLYGALRGDRTITAVEVHDSDWEQPTNVTLSAGQSWSYGLVATPRYGTGVTVEATGAVALDTINPWIVHATEAGEGKLIVKVGTTVMKEVTFTVTDGHRHCTCIGAEAAIPNHTCDATMRWTPIAKKSSSSTIMTDGGHYFLDWTGDSAQSLSVAKGAEVYLCLNGATIRAGQAITLDYSSVLHICDCSQGETGRITVTAGSETAVILMNGGTRTVNLYSGTISGSNSGNMQLSVQMSGGNPTFNMYGGTITGGFHNENGGNVRLTGQNGVFNMFAGTIVGGTTNGSGTNVYISKGQFHMTGGSILNGEGVTGESVCYAGAGTMTIGGTVAIDSILVASDKVLTVKDNLALANSGEPINITMEANGVFAEGEEGAALTNAHKSCFTTQAPKSVLLKDGKLEVFLPHTHCWCTNADSIPADHVCASNQEWTAIEESGNAFSIDKGGCYYLNWTGRKAKSITVNTTEPVHLCLNGAQIFAMKMVTLCEGSNLTICDCGTTGCIGVSEGATRSPILLDKNTAVSLYSGTVTGCLNNKRLAAVTVSNDSAVFNMYGGKVLCSQGKDLSGGNMVLTAGTANILGGTVEGGTEADSYGITVSGGQLTLGGDVDIDSVKLADGKTITVKDGLTTTAPISIAMEKAGIFAVAETGKSLSYEGKKSFASADAALNVACYTEGYALTAAPVGCLCGKTDGTHEDYCTKLDPIAWTGTGLPTETGNYYLTAPVAVEAATTVAADRHIKLWLQGNDITVAEGKSINNIFMVKPGASLALMDTTGNGAVDGLVESASGTGTITEHIVENEGSLVLDGAKLDASGLSLNQNGLAVRVRTGGSLTVKSGNIVGGTSTSTDENGGGAIYGQGNSVITVEGGTITGGTAKYGGNISSRGTIIITGGSITNGAYTSRGGNVYAQGGGSISISGSTTNISGGYKSGDSPEDLTDRSNVVAWNADVTLTDVTLKGGVWVTGNKTCTLSGNVVVNGDGVGLTLGATSNNGPTARAVIGENFETTSTVDLAIATWAKKPGNTYASGLTEAQANVFTIHTADVTKRQETGKDTWEIVHP